MRYHIHSFSHFQMKLSDNNNYDHSITWASSRKVAHDTRAIHFTNSVFFLVFMNNFRCVVFVSVMWKDSTQVKFTHLSKKNKQFWMNLHILLIRVFCVAVFLIFSGFVSFSVDFLVTAETKKVSCLVGELPEVAVKFKITYSTNY